jgi:hypothetical protein
LILSSEVFQICDQFFFYNLCVPLSFMYLSFYSVLCFTLVFVKVLSKFPYLFLCHLVFFVFGVLKFLECIFMLWLTMSNILSKNFSEISSLMDFFCGHC